MGPAGEAARGRRRLRLAAGAFFVALAVPAAVLVGQAYDRLGYEAFHQQRRLAEALVAGIDARLEALVEVEASRPVEDYRFRLRPASGGRFEPVSPLSALPPRSPLPGALGYFEVDARGRLTTPWLPAGPGAGAGRALAEAERERRAREERRIHAILAENRLVGDGGRGRIAPTGLADAEEKAATESRPGPAPAAPAGSAPGHPPRRDASRARASKAEAAPARAEAAADEAAAVAGREAGTGEPALSAFARLQSPAPATPPAQAKRKSALGRVEELTRKLARPYAARPRKETPPAGAPAPAEAEAEAARRTAAEPAPPAVPAGPIRTFAADLDPPVLRLLDSGHLVLFRRVGEGAGQTVQGALIALEPFLAALVERPFRASGLAGTANLAVAWRGDVLAAYGGAGAGSRYLSSAGELAGSLLHRARLSAPAGEAELLFTVNRLPRGPGADVIGATAAVLALVLAGGAWLGYRVLARQADLARQQRDFVAAVSHELRTPLTSIRMYAELLREGWADESRRRSYYELIHAESERLSRLIANVLALARIGRGEPALAPRPVPVEALADTVRERIEALVSTAGFELREWRDPALAEVRVRADGDAVVQIAINLADNAVKHAGGARPRAVEVAWRAAARGRVELDVRDRGPGIPPGEREAVFRPFHRGPAGDARAGGTGLGLALVRELARAQGAQVRLEDAAPGTRVTLSLPRAREEGPLAPAGPSD